MTSKARASQTIGLLISGGLDSSILLAHLLKQGCRIQPLYVAIGSAWQEAERRAVQQVVRALENKSVEPVVELEMPVGDLYGDHWSMTGRDVPDDTTPDDAVLLWGRNPLLLVKAVLWCSLHGISRLALATLDRNPFADARPHFFRQFEQALATATESPVEILRPFATMTKQQVLALGGDLPLELTFSCLAPRNQQHCGVCNKCAERIDALRSMSQGDPTTYADEFPRADAIDRRAANGSQPRSAINQR